MVCENRFWTQSMGLGRILMTPLYLGQLRGGG